MVKKLGKWAPLLMAFTIVILFAVGFLYISRMKQSLWEQSVNSVLEVTEQGGKSFDVYISRGKYLLGNMAASFAKYDSTDVDSIGARLDLSDDGASTFSVIDLTHGIIYINSKERTPLSESYLNEYLALPESGILEPYISEYNGHRVIGYFEKFTFADGAQGMIRNAEMLSDVSEKFTLSFYNNAGFSYIVNAKGEIMLRSGSENRNRTFSNIFDIVAFNSNSNDDVNALKTGMSGRNKGVMRLNFGGDKHIFAFVPLAGTEGWFLVSIVPDDIITQSDSEMIMSSQIMFWGIVVIMLVFTMFLFLTVYHRQQVRAEKNEVLYRERLFNLLVSNTDDVFLMLDENLNDVIYVSPNVERVMGVPAEDVKKDISGLQSILHGMMHENEIKSKLDIPMNESASFEGKYIHSDTGEFRWFVEKIYHTELDKMERYIVILADRTVEKQKEAALNEALEIAKVANESKSTFLANMSHDIRTPMNAIVGLATLLQRDADKPDKVREHTEKITSSSQHLLGLINDVLDMSKIETGNTSLNISEFKLADLIQELDSIIRLQAKARKQKFDITVKDIHNENLLGDRQRISQVMMNILSNAVKYTPDEGHVTLTVMQLGQVSHDIVRTRFIVKDNGIGMSEEYQRVIFQPFTREIHSTVNQIQGTGLGMAITKNLVELMGGSISVKSEQGVGSTFTIDFDLRIQHYDNDVEFWKEHNISNVLIVDDEVDVCTEILGAMSGTGVAMQFALNGPTAIQMTQMANQNGRDFDLILLDWKMPGMDGIETARKIRETVPANIPIMILTAYDVENIRDECADVGIDGVLSKPFFLSNFKEVIRNLNKKEQVTETEAEANSISGRHFLCAEDNSLNAEILCELLDMENASAEVVSNGHEAVEKFAKSPVGTYDAILMDVQMPVMDGYEATRNIRKLDHEQAESIPIIAMTANAFANDINDALESGMNAHIAKPVDMKKLVDVLGRLWRQE